MIKNNKVVLVAITLLIATFSVKAQDKSLFGKEQFVKGSDTLQYRILYPEGFSQDSIYPLVLFLHGAGERGSDNESQLVHGADLFLKEENRKDFPAVVIFPQVPKDDYWANVDVDRESFPLKFDFHNTDEPTTSMRLAMELLDQYASEKYIDTTRLYVGGLSMGGMGTFEIVSRKPETFAAAFAICGAADTSIAEKYRDGFFIWVFHGLQDNVVAPHYGKKMAGAINKAGGNANLTLYKDANHNSWDSAFAEPNLLSWLFSHQMGQEKENESE